MAVRDPVPADVVEACARGLLARERARHRAALERATELRRLAEEAARILADRHDVRRVWLFGSLAWGEPHGGTDVDLLVEGLAGERAGAAAVDVERIVGASVDLVRVEHAAPDLVERAKREGALLHDAG